MQDIPIIYKKWGLANNFNTYIEINEDLKKYPQLLEYVINHEKGHKESDDLPHEFNFVKPLNPINNKKSVNILYGLWMNIKLMGFTIIHPRTWIDLLPIQYKNKEWIYDKNLSILYVVLIILILILRIIF